MKSRLRGALYRALPRSAIGLASAALHRAKASYATYGEDLVAEWLLKDVRAGFYVDIGCFHPVVGSNTKRLYKAGWRGMNIDAEPHKIAAFNVFRRRDINVCCALDATEGEAPFYYQQGCTYGSMAGLSKAGVEMTATQMQRAIGSIPVKTRTLKQVLDEHRISKIDFLNIDVEGSEADILGTIAFDAYGIGVIGIEIRGTTLKDIEASPVHKLVSSRGYSIAAWTPPTVFYRA